MDTITPPVGWINSRTHEPTEIHEEYLTLTAQNEVLSAFIVDNKSLGGNSNYWRSADGRQYNFFNTQHIMVAPLPFESDASNSPFTPQTRILVNETIAVSNAIIEKGDTQSDAGVLAALALVTIAELRREIAQLQAQVR